MRYNYRVYAKIDESYEYIMTTDSEDVAKILANDNVYSRVLVIRHDLDLNMDEPHMLNFPKKIDVKNKKRGKRK